MSTAAQLPHFEPSQKYPDYIPYNPSQLLKDAISNDQLAYQRSDAAFAKRHPTMLGAERGTEAMIGQDVANVGSINPAIQNELYTSGLSDSLKSLDAAGNAGLFDSGAGGSAALGRSLGYSGNNFLRQQKADALAELGTGEQLFPRRQFGFGGETDTLINMLNTENYNNQRQGQYADQTLQDEFNWQIDASNLAARIQQQNNDAQAAAARKASIWGAISDGIQVATSAASGFAGCWVARAAFGEHDLRWLRFRAFLFTQASPKLRAYYLAHGEKIGARVRSNPLLQALFRRLMLKFI